MKDEAIGYLKEIGIDIFPDETLMEIQERLVAGFRKAVENPGYKFDKNQFVAIPNSINPISQDDWLAVPSGSRIIAASFGGSNWITALVEKNVDGLKTKTLRTTNIPISERTTTLAGFCDRIAKEIGEALQGVDTDGISAVALSLGFLQSNLETHHGIDARLLYKDHGRHWRTFDVDDTLPPEQQPLLGEKILASLKENHPSLFIERIYIQGDVASVMNNILSDGETYQHIPTGFVFGTGVNGAFGHYNLEAGNPAVVPPDVISKIISDKSPYKIDSRTIGDWIGGAYVLLRMLTAIKLLKGKGVYRGDANSFLKNAENFKDGRWISGAAKDNDGSYRQELNTLLQCEIEENDYPLIQYCAATILQQAGQLCGVLIAAILIVAAYSGEKDYVLIEGSFFHEAYSVRKAAEKTISFLLPHHQLTLKQGSGLIGAAQLGMAREYFISRA